MLSISREYVTLFLFTAFSVVLITYRVLHMNSLTYIFLGWNLVLAAVPYLLVRVLATKVQKRKSMLLNIVMASTWLLFFPNAPYIFTDLFHLKNTSSSIVWYDTILILSFAWTGMLFGFLSLWRIEGILQQTVGPLVSKLSVYLMLFIAAFGVYLGRYLRFNSWDIVSDPIALFYEVGHRFIHPFSHPRTWGMTIIFGLFLILAYSSFRLVREQKQTERGFKMR